MLADRVEPLALPRMARHRLRRLEVEFARIRVPERTQLRAERTPSGGEVERADLGVGVELEGQVALEVRLDQEVGLGEGLGWPDLVEDVGREVGRGDHGEKRKLEDVEVEVRGGAGARWSKLGGKSGLREVPTLLLQ